MARRGLIIGGGITGTAAAIALSRQGVDVNVVEREPVSGVLGSGISLIGPALRALDRLGVADRCVEAGSGVDAILVCDDASTVRHRVELPAAARPGMLGMLRPVLHEILVEEAASAGAELRLGQTVTAMHDDGAGVAVEMADGGTERYDLVVAADGLRSQTRTRTFGPLRPSFRGQAVFRAVVPRGPEVVSAYQFQGRDVHAGLTPTGPGTAYMFCLIGAADEQRPPQEQLPELMRHHLASFGGLAGELRDTICDPAAVDYRPLETLLLPVPWNRGGVVVIGDAAHTTTPQLAAGASMCLEDAVALGEEIGRGDPVDSALDRFTLRRHERCRFVVDASIRLSDGQLRPDGGGAEHSALLAEAVAVLAQEF